MAVQPRSLVSGAEVKGISSQGGVKPMESSLTTRSAKTVPRSLMTRTMYQEPGRVVKVSTRVANMMIEKTRVAETKEMDDMVVEPEY